MHILYFIPLTSKNKKRSNKLKLKGSKSVIYTKNIDL